MNIKMVIVSEMLSTPELLGMVRIRLFIRLG